MRWPIAVITLLLIIQMQASAFEWPDSIRTSPYTVVVENVYGDDGYLCGDVYLGNAAWAIFVNPGMQYATVPVFVNPGDIVYFYKSDRLGRNGELDGKYVVHVETIILIIVP